MIDISLNNQPQQLHKPMPLIQALQLWGYGDGKIAVAINGEFVPRSTYNERLLNAGDQIDIVKPVGGG
jgi:sulfur carrier protein